jgi:dTDP-glucose pyrophosphorylase
MKNWQNALIDPTVELFEALQVINDLGCQMVLVVDRERRLLGTLSDGDVRRALLVGATLQTPVSEAMCATPTVVNQSDDRETRLELLKKLRIHHLPVVNNQNQVVGFEIIGDYLQAPTREETVVIMAGGLGSRLKALTRDIPKPMLKVGSRPILETIVRSFSEQGFRKFYFAINFKAELIENHFGDGDRFGIKVKYLREDKRMGTAGALSMLPEDIGYPILVTNADLLTKADYGSLLEKHLLTGADATVGVRNYEMQVPFGVVKEEQGQVSSIIEKPVYQHKVSAGVNALSRSVLELVPRDEFYDMPTLLESSIKHGLQVRSHNLNGYWLDVGQKSDFEQANQDFYEIFE